MPTIRLVPSANTRSNSSYITVTNPDNMYANVDSTSYATVQHTRSSTTAYYLYIHGFNFNDVPSNATVTSFSVKIRAYESGLSTSSTYRISLYNNTTSIGNTTATASLSTTAQTLTIPTGSLTWDTLKGYGNNFRIRVPLRRNSSNTACYVYIYGAEIEVNYTLPDPRTITTSLTGNGTISPSGQTTAYDGDEFELTITPTTKTDAVTVANNNVDVTDELMPHYSSGTTATISETATSFTTELSASGAGFYTGSNTQGNYFNYAVNHTAESPGSTSTSYNTYVKDNGSNTATGWAWYAFDFSGIPNDAEIESVQVKCYGATENTTHDATHKSNITLWSGNDLKSTEQYFTSTSNQTITISDPGEWSRADLDDARLKFEVAYYGGRLFGITWSVTYQVGTDPDYYTYTYEVSGNATITVTIGSGARTGTIYTKSGNSWATTQTVTAVYKKVNNAWVEQSDWSAAFEPGSRYIIES